jgi:type I restriction enzyme S subunit
MTEGGDPDKLGRGCVWDGQVPGCLHQNHIFAVRPERSRLDPHFLALLLVSLHAKTYFLKTAKQTTNLASTNKSNIGRFPVLLPALDEQRETISALGEETADIDRLLSRAREEIALLREYRTRLIADVVTGKLDVRGVELPALDEAEALEDVDIEEDADGEETPEGEEAA